MKKYNESNIDFFFQDDCSVIKFDDSRFYRSYFGRLPGGKGVDFIVDMPERIIFIEVKNCLGHERENRHRTRTNGAKSISNTFPVITDYFEDEIPIKISMTLSCLMGAHTKKDSAETAEELETYFQAFTSDDVCKSKKEVIVVFVLEGNFGSVTRPKSAIMERIQQNINNKLKWLSHKKVYVVDSSTNNDRFFSMKILHE